MIYVALPYSHKDPAIERIRYEQACFYSAQLVKGGEVVQSPIVIGHVIRPYASLPGDIEFWRHFCLTMLAVCNEMHVLMLDGWRESLGVSEEIEFASEHEIEVKYIHSNVLLPHTRY